MQTSIDFKRYSFASGMRKFLFYCFLFTTIFVSACRVFSIDTDANNNYKIATSKEYFNSKFSKSAATLITVDVINDFEADDEEIATLNIFKVATNSFLLQRNMQFLPFSDCMRLQTLGYFFINLSRIPRFSFLSLNVLRI